MLSRRRLQVGALGSGLFLLASCAVFKGGAPPVVAPPAGEPGVSTPTAPPESLGRLLPVLGPPRAGSTGRVDWSPVAEPRALGALMTIFNAATQESAGAWRALSESPPHRAFALRRLMALHLEAGDTARADSAAAELAATPSVWQWEALRARADWALVRDGPARADSLLAPADRTGWPELERAAWLARRASLRAALGDTARAIELAQQAIRRYPSLAPAARALALLDAVLAARGESLGLEDEGVAAEVEFYRPNREGAIRRLRKVVAAGGAHRARYGIRLAEVLRLSRRYTEARRAAEAALAAAASPDARAAALLERARIERDAGEPAAAFSAYARAASTARDSALLESAWWESAQEAEDQEAWTEARRDYERVAALGRRRANDARLRLGLLWLAADRPDQALAAWEEGTTEPIHFWRGTVRRRSERAAGDSLLAALARRPGYGFYRAAARETLGWRGWPGTVARDSCALDSLCPGLGLARDLIMIGARADAMLLIGRFVAGDPRVTGGGETHEDPFALLTAARLAYAAGSIRPAIRYATLSGETEDSLSAAVAWEIAPWAYPAAFDSLLQAFPLTASTDSFERALVQAVIWQESKFDQEARSRSDALGLLQLKLGTASDVARWLGEPAPSERALHEPALNLRYGTAYLRRQFQRFGSLEVALAAYNAGPGRIPERWPDWVKRGGPALFAELLVYPETRDYVKKILGIRQAYRELAPTSVPR